MTALYFSQANNYVRKSTDRKKIKLLRLALEITNKCTNYCKHCFSFCAPSQNGTMDKHLAFDIIDQASRMGFLNVHLLGGEPFLHPDLMEIINKIFQKNMSVLIGTNGFWGTTEETAVKEIMDILKKKPQKPILEIILSCSPFHADQAATPPSKIFNVIKATKHPELKREDFALVLQGFHLRDWDYFSDLPSLLDDPGIQPGEKFYFKEDTVVLLSTRPLLETCETSLDTSVGRAKDLDPGIRKTKSLAEEGEKKLSQNLFNGTLCVGFNGTKYLDYSHVANNIFPVSGKDVSLMETLNILNGFSDAHMLLTAPFGDFLEYFDEQTVFCLKQQSHSKMELFNRLYQAFVG